FVPTVPRGMLGRAKAYLAIAGNQAGAIRKRLLVQNFKDGTRTGTYWGDGSAVTGYRPDDAPGYSKEIATTVIATIRTDMDAFSEAESAVLINHGYLLADIAIETHAPALAGQATPKQVPFPEWMDEDKARAALKDSGRRRLFGRY